MENKEIKSNIEDDRDEIIDRINLICFNTHKGEPKLELEKSDGDGTYRYKCPNPKCNNTILVQIKKKE